MSAVDKHFNLKGFRVILITSVEAFTYTRTPKDPL